MADAMEVERPSGAPDPKGKAKAGATTAAAPLPPGTKRFEVKKWNAVAMWSWAICTDTCAICRNNLYEPSIEYQANPSGDADHPGLVKEERESFFSFFFVFSGLRSEAKNEKKNTHSFFFFQTEQLRQPLHRLGLLRARLPPRLHPAVAQDALGLPALQQGVGVCEDREDPSRGRGRRGRRCCRGWGVKWWSRGERERERERESLRSQQSKAK